MATPSSRTRVVGQAAIAGSADLVPVNVTLEYTARDPYTVVALLKRRDRVTEWVFARELLTDGRLGAEGPGGDVTVSPAANDSEIRIELSSPFGQAVIWLDADAVTRFLEETYRLVPAGTESRHINWPRELTALLHGGDDHCG